MHACKWRAAGLATHAPQHRSLTSTAAALRHCALQCTPTSPNGGYHLGWCAACDGDKPSKCTKCVDKNNGFPMYVQQDKDCGFCTSLHGDKCLKCRNGDGKCVICDTDNGYIFDGVFSCKKP